VLVPTTILAEQHYRTFRERFSGFPVTIDFVSRFKSRREIELALGAVAKGETDIVIGTHGLLSRKVEFSRLGLLIVDEEHRFGVGQKEKIKEMSRQIDVLTLTATPIPRTLHMALSGIRNISVIETPPEERLSVKSAVTVFHDDLIRQAMSSELQRNGQVFFVHNRISDIYKISGRIQELVPGAAIGVAHGQMREKELEGVMHRFFAGEINVLVSTAIIGAGLDIPRANTIIINRADKMGLADLYQLRGRVGRSNLKGYAYFLAPPEPLLTEEARKRLQAVQEMSYLGAGFRLALKDLEIRGAGEIFGAEQSGHINEIGFELYIEMLEEAVAGLRGTEIKEEPEPVIELKASAFIPEEYIEDVTLRLSFYRRIASLKTEKEIGDFETEMKDRFGALPGEVVNLLKVMRVKTLAGKLMVTKVRQAGEKVRAVFSPETPVQPAHIFDLQKKRKKAVKFFPDGFELELKGAGWEKVYEEVRGALEELAEKAEQGAAETGQTGAI
jgi:transcription-repair coupling factor (superfamily II helicase)